MGLSLLWFLTHHSIKSCWKTILFLLRAQNKSISAGRICSAMGPLLSLSSFLMLFKIYRLKTISILVALSYIWIKEFHKWDVKLWHVRRLSFLIGTFLACPMKSTLTATIMLELETFNGQTSTDFLSVFLSSLFFVFRR